MIMLDLQHTPTRLIMMVAATNLGMIIARNVNTTESARGGQKVGMTIEEIITRYKNNAEYERTHGNLQGCLEFRQLVKWLEQLQKIKAILNDDSYYEEYGNSAEGFIVSAISEVLKDGKID